VSLVRNTAFGFTRRFKSSAPVCSWLNMGIAEWVANSVVTQDDEIRAQVQKAVQRVRETHSLGGNFFTADQVALWQHGLAASMVDFLLKYSPPATAPDKAEAGPRDRPPGNDRFRRLLEGIKEGIPWEKCLREVYGMTPEQLAERYGQFMGIPNVRP
jgi:hypothetical protein